MSYTHILSVLVVDDEKPIREELRIFNWESCNAVMIGEASNGREALEMCAENQPDLLIADITMPVMDGISLMSAVKEKYPRTQVVLLTCHTDFEYARQAIQMGALAYIIKVTMRDEDIREVIRKAGRKIENQEMLDSFARESVRRKMAMAFRDLLRSDAAQLRGKTLPMPQPRRLVRLCMGFQSQDWIFVDREVQNYLERTIAEWFPFKTGEYILLLPPGSLEDASQTMDRLVRNLKERLEANLSYIRSQIRVYALLGDITSDLQETCKNYGALSGWRDRQFYQAGRLLFCGVSQAGAPLTEEAKQPVEHALRQLPKRDGEIMGFWDGFFRRWALTGYFLPDDLKNYAISLTVRLAGAFSSDPLLPDVARRILSCGSLDQMISIMTYFFSPSFSKESRGNSQIRMARRMIRERLGEPIRLKELAGAVGLSPNYFSRIFSEQTGESFNEYVTRQRMERATFLLKHSDLKIYEVADRVGIPSYRYFSSLFKNWMGKTPKEYQKQCGGA